MIFLPHSAHLCSGGPSLHSGLCILFIFPVTPPTDNLVARISSRASRAKQGKEPPTGYRLQCDPILPNKSARFLSSVSTRERSLNVTDSGLNGPAQNPNAAPSAGNSLYPDFNTR